MHKKSEHFSESINISKKKSLKFVTFYSLKNSPNLVKNHLPKKGENFSESTKISIKKSPKLVTIYSLKMSPKLVNNKSPKKVKILVNQQNFL